MAHDHHNHSTSGKKLLISTVLNFIIAITEVIGGLFSNSLALLSDALHNLGDSFAVFIAYIADIVSRRDYTNKKTFGYKRVEIIAALFNAVVLIVIIIYLFFESIKRIQHPEPVRGKIMLTVAVIGLLANLLSVLLLRSDSGKNINVRAAYLHLLGDTVSSVAVILGAAFISLFELYWIDPLITMLVGVYLLKETYSVLTQTVDILMQGTPKGLDLEKVKETLEELSGIDNVHHVHAWNLTDREVHFECHIDLNDDWRVSQTEKLKENIHELLLNKFGITHVTVQYEFNCCDNKDMIHFGEKK